MTGTKRYKVTHTQKGRVVYDRKPHYYSPKDAKRILRAVIFGYDGEEYKNLVSSTIIWGDVVGFVMSEFLIHYTAVGFSPDITEKIRDFFKSKSAIGNLISFFGGSDGY